ncbi:BTB/POZ domain-containing protein At2g13690 [Silene latifolia]|uniref:BTB/POZ domain-containing protein At2g13690 n=1 Tax=Silene latifolia TaxID=37657 RepID=UPI003D78144D
MSSSSIPSHRKPPRRKSNPNPNSTIKPSSSSSSSSWCCSFKSPPKSPETLISLPYKYRPNYNKPTAETLAKSVISSVSSSPMSAKSGLSLVGRIDPRKILSPGRVSPIDDPIPHCQVIDNVGPTDDEVEVEVDVDVVGPMKEVILEGDVEVEVECEYDVRLSLKGKNGGGCLVLEVNSRVLKENSVVFDGLINGNSSNGGKNGGFWRIEVPDVEDLGIFRETIELMFEEDVARKLIKIGPYRAIDILEVSASIKFNRGVQSCLKYLEAVPWTEEEEEKLSKLFSKFKFDDASSTELFSRLNLNDCNTPQQNLASQLIRSITACENTKPRNELKSMVKGLLSKSSVYEKDHHDITKDDLYSVCHSCLSSLVTLFQDDLNSKKNLNKPLIESVSWQVENINWLLEILLDRHMAEDFVDVWAAQTNLLDLHERASPMVRYELSRISAVLFTAMGTRKLQCGPESRSGLLRSWFGPMLLDFGWLQRCRKGLNVRELEEAMGQTLLTLPLKQQYALFMEWFRCFSKHGTECPNLGKAFQVWWRRSFLRGSETRAIESR